MFSSLRLSLSGILSDWPLRMDYNVPFFFSILKVFERNGNRILVKSISIVIKVENLNPLWINRLNWIPAVTITNEHHYKTKETTNYVGEETKSQMSMGKKVQKPCNDPNTGINR